MLRSLLRPISAFALTSMLSLCTVTMPACTGSEDEAEVAATPPPADPRFATAQALVAHFNALSTMDPIDVAGLNELFYAETPLQEAMIAVSRTMEPVFPLNDAMQERFKQPLDPSTPKAFVAKANGPAKITNDQGERATATYKDWDGSSETLQLVKYNGRWWLSGYTMEHNPNLKNVTGDQIALMRLSMKAMAEVAPGLTPRVRSGEFKTAVDARAALQAGIIQYYQQHASEAQQVAELIKRNPKLKPSTAGARG